MFSTTVNHATTSNMLGAAIFQPKNCRSCVKNHKIQISRASENRKNLKKKFRGENLKPNSNHSVECGGSVYFLLRSDGRGLFILLLFGRQLAFALQGQFAFPLGGGCSGSGVFLPFTFGRNFRHQWLFPRQRESSRCFCE